MTGPSTLDPRRYWRKQVRRTLILLGIWFVVGYLLSIFLIEPLNAFVIGGVPLGFWMAQQGSIFIFVLLIFIYARFSGKLDHEAGFEETEESSAPPSSH